jgi:hypothetical protein
MSGKGVGDPDGWWAHLIYTAYPRRAEDELPPERRQRLNQAAGESEALTTFTASPGATPGPRST